ncbi:MAG: hypothetical protein WDO56_30445 [Gammaproteobacteria bacterium]
MAGAKDNPVVYGDNGRGEVQPLGTNSQELTTITFSLSEDYAPRAHFSWEIHGGLLKLRNAPVETGNDRQNAVALDLERSRVKFSLIIEAHGDPPSIKVIGAPRYDVHLVRSPINEAFPIPTVEHLSLGDENLCRTLGHYARQRRQNAAANIAYALPLAGTANKKGNRLADRIRAVGELCARHLPENGSVFNQAPEIAHDLSSTYEEMRRQTPHIFDEALVSMGGIDLREQGDGGASLASFQEKVNAFRAQPDDVTANDALDIFSAHFGIPGSSGEREPPHYLSDEIIASTYSKIEQALNLQNQCFGQLQAFIDALTPTVAKLLPAFSDQLRKDALNVSEFVDPVWLYA